MKILNFAAVLCCAWLCGCGTYLHSDGYQKLTDSAADAVEAAAFKQKVDAIGASAMTAQSAYEMSIAQNEVAQRDYFVAAAIRHSALFTLPGNQASHDAGALVQRHGLSFLEAVADGRLSGLVSNDRADKYATDTAGTLVTYRSERNDLSTYLEDYGRAVAAFKQDYPEDKKTSLSCSSLLAKSSEIGATDLDLLQVLTACQHIDEKTKRINFVLFGVESGPDCKSTHYSLEATACAIATATAQKADAEREEAEIAAQIKKVQEDLKAKSDSSAGPAQIKALLDKVDDLKSKLAAAPSAAQALGFDALAGILQQVLVDDLNDALAAARGDASGAAAPAAADASSTKTGQAARAALVGAVIRAFSTGLTFGQSVAQPAKGDPNVTIIALAELRNRAALAKIEAALQSERAALEERRLEAEVAEASNLAISRTLSRQVTQKHPDADLMSLSGDDQQKGDSAIEAFVASVNSGRAVDAVLESRVEGLDVKKLTQQNSITADTIDQVNKAVAEALRAYGKGGVDPALVVATILGALAVAGIWY